MRNRFELQLEELSQKLIKMGSLCEKAIANAAEALNNGDLELAKTVIREDEEINYIDREIESLCLKLLLQQQPVAKDLRQISAALKMITDMERIGDQASDIADIIISAGMSEVGNFTDITKMANATKQMVHDSIQAYVTKDLSLAKRVMVVDDEVDHLFDNVKSRLVRVIARDLGSQGERAIDILMIAKYLERIGDHATNIAEWVEFSITGVHKAHVNIESK